MDRGVIKIAQLLIVVLLVSLFPTVPSNTNSAVESIFAVPKNQSPATPTPIITSEMITPTVTQK